MNEEDQQSSSSQPAPDDEEAKNFVNQPGYQKGAMGMVNLIVDVMNDTHEYKEAMFCKHLLMECSRKYHLDLEEQIERVMAHAQEIDEFDKYMKAKNGELNPKRISEQQFAYAIDQLMESVDESGKYIFKIQRHWIAVFRVAVDLHLIGENDYKGFCKWIDTIHPGAFRVKLTQGDLKQISNSDCYMKPFDKWGYAPMGNVKKEPYLAMTHVVVCFRNLLGIDEKIA